MWQDELTAVKAQLNYCDDDWASHIQPIWDQSVLDAEEPLCNRMLSASQQSAFEDSRGKRLALIQGPPGTGKTTLIAHMIGQRVFADRVKGNKKGCVFLFAPNNKVCNNLIQEVCTLKLPAISTGATTDGGKPIRARPLGDDWNKSPSNTYHTVK